MGSSQTVAKSSVDQRATVAKKGDQKNEETLQRRLPEANTRLPDACSDRQLPGIDSHSSIKLFGADSGFKSSQMKVLDSINYDSSEDYVSDEDDFSSDSANQLELGAPKRSETAICLREYAEKYVELRHSVFEANSASKNSSALSPGLSFSGEKLEQISETPPVWESREVFENKFFNHGKHRFSVNQYLLEKRLGRGAFGKTWRAICLLSQNTYAVKILDKEALKATRIYLERGKPPTNEYEISVKNEIKIIKSMHHPNVVNLQEIVNDENHSMLYLVLEFVPGGTVCTLEGECNPSCDPLPLNLSLSHMRGMLNGIDYLHSNSVFHGDLKPENVLLTDDGTVKISDFGTSRIIDGDYAKEHRGTLAFTAPEVGESEKFLWRPVDLWAVGVIYYIFLFGKCPFAGSISEVLDQLDDYEVTIPQDDLPKDVIDLLMRLLQKDPVERITMSQLKEHPWLTKDNFKFEKVLGSFGTRSMEERKFCPEALQNQIEEIQEMLDTLLLIPGEK